MGLDFISFHTPKGVGRPILAFVSYFEQFYPLSSGLGGGEREGRREEMDFIFATFLARKLEFVSSLQYPKTPFAIQHGRSTHIWQYRNVFQFSKPEYSFFSEYGFSRNSCYTSHSGCCWWHVRRRRAEDLQLGKVVSPGDWFWKNRLVLFFWKPNEITFPLLRVKRIKNK